jgi:hypothetical protein
MALTSFMNIRTKVNDVAAMAAAAPLGSRYGYLSKTERRNEGIICGMFSLGLASAPPIKGLHDINGAAP